MLSSVKVDPMIRHLLIALILSACVTPAKTPLVKERDNQAEQLLAQGFQLAKDGLLREAIEVYQKVLFVDANNQTARRNLGIVYIKAGDYKSGTMHLEKSLDAYAENFDAQFYLGEGYRGQEKYAEAIFRYNYALKIKPNEVRALKALAWTYFKVRYYSEALVNVKKATAASPQDDQLALIEARILMRLRRDQDALAIINKAEKKVGGKVLPYYLSLEGDVLTSLGKTNEAVEAYQESLKKQPLLSSALLGLGKIQLMQNKIDDAEDNFERAIRINNKLPEAHYYLAKTIEEKNPARAMHHYRIFRQQAASDPEFVDLTTEAKNRMGALIQKKKPDNDDTKED